ITGAHAGKGLGEQVRLAAAGCNQFDGIAIEAGEYRAAEATAVERDNAIGKIATSIQHRKSGLERRTIDLHPGCSNQAPNGSGNVFGAATIPASHDPDK